MSRNTRAGRGAGRGEPLNPGLENGRGGARRAAPVAEPEAQENAGANNQQGQDAPPAWLGAFMQGLQATIATAVQASVTVALGAAQGIGQVPPPLENVNGEDQQGLEVEVEEEVAA